MEAEGKVYKVIEVVCDTWEEVCKAKKIAEGTKLEFDSVRTNFDDKFVIEFDNRKQLTEKKLAKLGF